MRGAHHGGRPPPPLRRRCECCYARDALCLIIGAALAVIAFALLPSGWRAAAAGVPARLLLPPPPPPPPLTCPPLPPVQPCAAAAAAPSPPAPPPPPRRAPTCAPPPPPRPADVLSWLAATVAAELGSMGAVDAATLAPSLARYYVHSWVPANASGAVYDVGANLGDVSDALVAALAPGVRCHRFQRSVNLTGHREACAFWVWPIYAFEPNAETLAALRARAALERWELAGYEAVHAALSDAVPPGGELRFYTEGAQGDQQGALSAAAGETQRFVAVPATTVDAFRAERGEDGAPIFLLKVDAEGFDGAVLRGAERALAARRVKFVVVEYNSKWRHAPVAAGGGEQWSLQGVAARMRELGYECHLLTAARLVPLWGEYWQPAYESYTFSNFICAQLCDPDILHLAAVWARGGWALPRQDCAAAAAAAALPPAPSAALE